MGLTALGRSVQDGLRRCREVRRLHGVSTGRQLARWLGLRRSIVLSRTEFHSYRLWRDDLDPVAALAYSTADERRRVGRLVNPLEARPLTHLKSLTQERLAAIGIPGPELLAKLIPGGAAGAGNRATTRDDLSAVLRDAGPGGVVLKPEDTMRGEAVLVARSADASGVTRFDGRPLGLEALWHLLVRERGREWRVERRLLPDATLPGLSAGQVLTLRVFTVVVGGQAVPQAATLKIPVTGDGIDNMARGNLGAPVDLRRGTLGAAWSLSEDRPHEHHPVSGAVIKGEGLPGLAHWIDLACRAAEGVRPLRAVGWDIALAEGGAVVLEGNVPGSAEVVQRPQDEGFMRGPYLRMLREVGAETILAGRRRIAAWRQFEAEELARG